MDPNDQGHNNPCHHLCGLRQKWPCGIPEKVKVCDDQEVAQSERIPTPNPESGFQGPEVINFLSCSAQLRLNLIRLINVKMPFNIY